MKDNNNMSTSWYKKMLRAAVDEQNSSEKDQLYAHARRACAELFRRAGASEAQAQSDAHLDMSRHHSLHRDDLTGRGLSGTPAHEYHSEAAQDHRALAGPTAEQMAALTAYAAWAGDGWKDRLASDWMRAGSEWDGPYHLLHQLRNNCGPSWLREVTTNEK
jgi:hypothetical protein